MISLRPYQRRAIDQLYDWFRAGNEGNPCLVLPTGAGKSVIIAGLCRDALQQWPETRVLMLTHVKELIEQNAAKMRAVWYNAPMGIYSASIGKRQIGEPITFAGIQSVAKKAAMLGHVDLCIIDEAHLISHKDEGGYRSLIRDLTAINPRLRVIGLTATPWRLGHGYITDGDALFDDLIEPIGIEELLSLGHLAPLRSKHTDLTLSTAGVHKRGGEYIESELAQAVDTDQNNRAVAAEIVARADGRASWLVFCAGVNHAQHMRDCLLALGVKAACVTGATPKGERARILADFKAKRITALTNANVLTTGFDAPDTDLIAFLRPTMSPVLYAQMAGRGLRPKSHTDHCLVLDFAGNVATHGPIVNIRPPVKKGDGDGEAPVKVCPECAELIHPSIRICPACGYEFPPPEAKPARLHNDDIMGRDNVKEMELTAWKFSPYVSRASQKEMIRVTYYGALSDPPVHEYLAIFHEGYAQQKAMKTLASLAQNSGIVISDVADHKSWCDYANANATPPRLVRYTVEGKFFTVKERIWE